MRSLALILLLSFGYIAMYAQDSSSDYQIPELKKNVIYVSANPVFIITAVDGNYERMLLNNEMKSMSLWAQVGYGLYYQYSVGSTHQFTVGLTELFGKNNKFFEVNLGYMYVHKGSIYPYELIIGKHNPTGSIGYRYHKIDGNFLFRIGVGYPESIYLSFGYCFGK